jgi:hypothetical protein
MSQASIWRARKERMLVCAAIVAKVVKQSTVQPQPVAAPVKDVTNRQNPREHRAE